MNTVEDSIDPGYSILNEGTEKIKVISIYEYVQINGLESVNFIKLVIEGFELDALKGAYETIIKYRPRLQICLYHKQEDLIDFPLYIHESFKELGYKLYVDHHSD